MWDDLNDLLFHIIYNLAHVVIYAWVGLWVLGGIIRALKGGEEQPPARKKTKAQTKRVLVAEIVDEGEESNAPRRHLQRETRKGLPRPGIPPRGIRRR